MAEKILNGTPASVQSPDVSSTSTPIPPAGVPNVPAAAPVDIAGDAAGLNRLVGTRGTRVSALFGKPTVSASEKGLPGGSIAASWERADEFGPTADHAAHQVALRHPEIFPELAAPRSSEDNTS